MLNLKKVIKVEKFERKILQNYYIKEIYSFTVKIFESLS